MEILVGAEETYRMIGLSNGDSDGSDTDIDYAFHLGAALTLSIKGQGTINSSVSLFEANDALKIELRGPQVYFFQNGVLRNVSHAPPTLPLRVDTSLFALGTHINQVRLLTCSNPQASCSDFGPWANPVGVSYTSTQLQKVGGRPDWNAGASSTNTISCLDGYVEATVTEAGTARMFGLGTDDVDQAATDIEWALYLRADNQLEVRESGGAIATVGTYAPGDLLQILVQPSGAVSYYRNGSILHASSVAAQLGATLRLDTSFSTLGGSLGGLRVVDTQGTSPSGIVCWKNMVGTQLRADGIFQSTQATGWTHGASSVHSIEGDGYVETVVAETNSYRMIGLSSSDLSPSDTDIEYALHLGGTATLAVRGPATIGTSVSLYQTGDVLRVERQGTDVLFLQNGVIRDIAGDQAAGPLYVDTSLFDVGSTLETVRLKACDSSAFPCTDLLGWQRPIGLEYTASSLRMSEGRSNAWNVGTASTQSIHCRDGYVETTVTENTTSRFFGLGVGNASPQYADVDWAFYLRSDGTLQIWENGAPVRSLGAYEPGEVLRVQVQSSGLISYFRNGNEVYSSGVAAAAESPLHLDTSFATIGATLGGLNIVSHCGP